MAAYVVTKPCFRCCTNKPKSEFHRDSSKPDGLNSYCKICQRSKYREPGARQRFRASSLRYVASERGKLARKTWKRRHPEKVAASSRRYRADSQNAAKRRARGAVTNAIAKGALPPAKTLICADCSAKAETYHHESYEKDKRLDVVALCRRCHGRRHRS